MSRAALTVASGRHCQAGYHTHCVSRQPGAATGAQSEYVRVLLADGTLVATPGQPDEDLIPSLLAASDVLGTGWFAAVAAEVGPGKAVAVVGDGAVIDPGKVFDLNLPLEDAVEGYLAMDERRATKVLLTY